MLKWVKKSESNIRKAFERTQKSASSIIFIEKFDSIAPK
jgi:SpoVK/Ycf46/Vps4 family AAA+-type ATPase